MALIKNDNWAASEAYLRGVELFNAGYYWEAHEAWEPLWLAHGRRGAVAGVLQGLIKLAAAGVKIREGRPAGARSHAARAALLFQEARRQEGRFRLGLDLDEWIEKARSLAENPPSTQGPQDAPVFRVFEYQIAPCRWTPSTR